MRAVHSPIHPPFARQTPGRDPDRVSPSVYLIGLRWVIRAVGGNPGDIWKPMFGRRNSNTLVGVKVIGDTAAIVWIGRSPGLWGGFIEWTRRMSRCEGAVFESHCKTNEEGQLTFTSDGASIPTTSANEQRETHPEGGRLTPSS